MAAATVLYRPDAPVLDALLSPLESEGVALFIFINGPISDECEALLARSPATLLRSSANLGLGYALNAVTEAASAGGFEFILLLDQDSAPSPDLATSLVSRFDELPSSAAAIGPKLAAPPGEDYLVPWVSRRASITPTLTEVDFLPTSGTLVSIEAWNRVGPFRSDFFIDGLDVEWCFRAWAAGRGCYLADDIVMWHRWGDTTESSWHQPQILRQTLQRSFYYLRNTTAILRLPHMPLRWRIRSTLRMMLQATLLLCSKPLSGHVWKTVASAFSSGLRGRLGPIPPDRSSR